MTIDLKVIGAGRARTETTSLKLALEQLLGGICFHYIEYKHQPDVMPPGNALSRHCRWIPIPG